MGEGVGVCERRHNACTFCVWLFCAKHRLTGIAARPYVPTSAFLSQNVHTGLYAREVHHYGKIGRGTQAETRDERPGQHPDNNGTDNKNKTKNLFHPNPFLMSQAKALLNETHLSDKVAEVKR